MIDVHAPDQTPHGFSDFMIHMLTITLGLLIALGLENAVEALHHRHLRREAEVNIRKEIEGNRQLLLDCAGTVTAERNELGRFLLELQLISDGQPSPHGKIDLSFHESPIPDAAWRTANGTGVLAYMDYDEVQKYAAVYQEQDLLETAQQAALEDYEEFLPLFHASDGDMTKTTAAEALPLVRKAYGHLTGMLDIGAGTVETYNDALK